MLSQTGGRRRLCALVWVACGRARSALPGAALDAGAAPTDGDSGASGNREAHCLAAHLPDALPVNSRDLDEVLDEEAVELIDDGLSGYWAAARIEGGHHLKHLDAQGELLAERRVTGTLTRLVPSYDGGLWLLLPPLSPTSSWSDELFVLGQARSFRVALDGERVAPGDPCAPAGPIECAGDLCRM